MSAFSSQERQQLITMYTTQYNQTNLQITRLFNTLDDIRSNINNLIGNNNMNTNNMNNRNSMNNMNNRNSMNNMNNRNSMNNMNNRNSMNRDNRTARQNTLRSSNNHSYIYYDYANPIDRSTYVSTSDNHTPDVDIANFLSDVITNNTSNINAHDNNPNIINFLTTFLNSVPIRPTEEQINSASRLVIYADIQTPNSLSCAISLEPFLTTDNVRQLNHCGHIFFPEQFNQWFSNNVRCPVCRHDIRTPTPTTTTNTTPNTTTNTTPNTNLNTITNIIDQLIDPLSNNTDDILLFETILRSNINSSS
jgi:hypothetical protein